MTQYPNNKDADYGTHLKSYRRIFEKLPSVRKRQFWGLTGVILVLALTETLAVGLISFYAAAVSDPESTLKIGFISYAETFLGEGGDFTKKSLIGFLSLAVVFAVIFKNTLRGAFVYSVSRYSASLEAYFGHRLLENFLHKPYDWYLQQNSADLIQVVNWRTYVGRNFVTPSLNILSESCVLLALLFSLLLIEPLIFLLFLVVQGGATFYFYKKLKQNLDRNARLCKEKDRIINREVTKAIHGYKDVKITSTAPHFMNQFDLHADSYARNFGRQQFWREAPLLTLESVGFVLVCGAILFMLYVLEYSPLAITGTTALLAVTAWRTLPALNRVVASLTTMRTAFPYVESLLPTLSELTDIPASEPASTDQPIKFKDSIEFRDVSFTYPSSPERKILNGFNLTIKRGQTIGVMGPSGCGKSTLIDLLVGLLKPTAGKIIVDGQSLTPEHLTEWTKNIGYVPQFPYIFDGTLAENVAFGQPANEIDRAEILKVCRMAAIDFLDLLPDGIDSMIGERGVRLSGGQRQRVAIARALYRNPELIIFDEATSALDELKDAEIRQLISMLKGERTLVVVSHRRSTVESCDGVIRF
ncbi:ABC transporter ATP-binding protein/permease [Desulfuromonas sp. KJ2020]|uniref:ABC transporter ATP-binding protein n=1 Tax=Desulfuromonas sp. KJ2020 TaxID=2919173 RepID=UPI0020A6F31C|nr:ABC transporter ATP-binding protein [Desulfuromonas sp. KJ2020]MCP3177407.1 ABC transporter ATP-binding protein/permease [Desulfuromonas sp. KJ2020]